MCLAIPMKLVEITGSGVGKVDAGGVKADVSLAMAPDAKMGDYLIVHAGFAIEILDHASRSNHLLHKSADPMQIPGLHDNCNTFLLQRQNVKTCFCCII